MARAFKMNYKQYDTSQGYGNAREWRKAFNAKMSGREAEEILLRSPRKQKPETILDVMPGASLQEIKKAYHKKMMEWHPDRNPHRLEEATEMAKEITAAYTLLSS